MPHKIPAVAKNMYALCKIILLGELVCLMVIIISQCGFTFLWWAKKSNKRKPTADKILALQLHEF